MIGPSMAEENKYEPVRTDAVIAESIVASIKLAFTCTK